MSHKSRPNAPQQYWKNWSNTSIEKSRTNVLIEPCMCENFKIILEMANHLCYFEHMQNEDIFAIIKKDLLKYGEKYATSTPKPRPTMPESYWDNWDSDNHYTRTKIQIEYCARDCFNVIVKSAIQILQYDGLTIDDILAVIWSDLERHIVWEDSD